MSSGAAFAAGRNIAMKVPPHVCDATVRFYREVLGLVEIAAHAPAIVFEFGTNRLWIDRVPGTSQAETWLEVVANDLEAASALLADAGVVRCDDIEPLPPGFRGFWVSSPASIVHLVCEAGAAGGRGWGRGPAARTPGPRSPVPSGTCFHPLP
jgi:catechol 2,3-dioxygenase-like lactoylglutathione lyase family enzyme